MPNPDISSITLPNGSTYNFKDAQARNSIPTKTSDLTNDSSFMTVGFSGTAIVFDTAVQYAEEVSF